MIYDVLIVGAGVTGGMLARELSKYRLHVCLLEKEHDVACGASKANSGIIHAGFDPVCETLKAQLNTKGVPLLYEAAEELHVPFERNGSLVTAFKTEEEAELQVLLERGRQNGISGLKLLSGEEARALEPALSDAVTGALLAPSAGIISPYELTVAAIGNAMDNGVALLCGFSVCAVEKENGVFCVRSEDGACVKGKFVVNCAGGYAGEIAALAGDDGIHIIPRAGEYLLLDKTEGTRVSHTIFQVPTERGKGILVTPTAEHNLLVGPTASFVSSPDSTETTFAGLREVRTLAAKSVPGIDFSATITSFCGVRATEEKGDFILRESETLPGLIHVAGIDSPGLTCSVALARETSALLETCGLKCEPKENWDGRRADPYAFRKKTDSEKNAWIQTHPEYGKIVCRCEGVTEGEILEAIRQNPPAHDLDGIKRRTRVGMGRCQGGFCTPHELELLADELGIGLEEVTKKGGVSRMTVGSL